LYIVGIKYYERPSLSPVTYVLGAAIWVK